MIQFFRFNREIIEETEFTVISGKKAAKFFAQRFLYLILFVYSTMFLAVALPFVKTPFVPIYFIGSMATCFFLIRILNHAVKYFLFNKASISVTRDGIEIISPEKGLKHPADQITYIELNPLGNLVIREKYIKTSFPLMLLDEQDREMLISLFQDMAPNRTKVYRKIWEFIDAIVVALVLAVHIIQYVVQAYFIPTGSMEDTLKKGDHLFVEKITYGPIIPQMIGMNKHFHLYGLSVRGVERGDIVIFKPPHEKDKDYIKRCIAIPGDYFDIKNGYVYINGVKQIEPYVKDITTWPNDGFNFQTKNEIQGTVPAGKVIVMGDNRTNSQDSRYFGYLDIDRIKGRAFVLYWNTSQILKLDFSRFGLIR